MTIQLHPHARQRMRERGASADEIRRTVREGVRTTAKFGRTRFRHTFSFSNVWNGTYYEKKQVDALAARIPNGWIVITVIVKYF